MSQKLPSIKHLETFADELYHIGNDFIKFPLTVDEKAASVATFQHLSMLPNIVRQSTARIKKSEHRGRVLLIVSEDNRNTTL